TTPGIGRADVWVFDATNLGSTLGGAPLTVLTMFGDTPRALAVSPNGSTVYAAVFQSGNQTTALSEGVVCDGGSGAPACPVRPGGQRRRLPRRRAGAQRRRKQRDGPRDRAGRQVQSRERTLGGPPGSQLGQRRPLLHPGRRRLPDRRHQEPAGPEDEQPAFRS